MRFVSNQLAATWELPDEVPGAPPDPEGPSVSEELEALSKAPTAWAAATPTAVTPLEAVLTNPEAADIPEVAPLTTPLAARVLTEVNTAAPSEVECVTAVENLFLDTVWRRELNTLVAEN